MFDFLYDEKHQINDEEGIEKVGIEDIKRTVKEIFRDNNRVIVITKPIVTITELGIMIIALLAFLSFSIYRFARSARRHQASD